MIDQVSANDLNQLTAQTRAGPYVSNTDLLASLDLPNGSKVEQGYDALQRPTSVVNRTGTTNLARYSYAYDTRDVRTGMQSQVATDPLQQINYAYDAVDQLTGEQASGGAANTAYTNAFSYDAMGNRTRHENTRNGVSSVARHTPNALNQLTALSSQTGAGARQTTGFAYDVSGNMTEQTGSDGSKTLYSYDDADRLGRIEWRSSTGTPQRKSEFRYDFASRRAVSAEFTWTAGAWVQQSETRRVFDGMDSVQERNALNEVTASYVRDGNIGGILSRSSQSGTSFFHYDGSGNVTALSDETGALVGRYSYDAFGNTLEVTGARAQENPFRFSTKELHAASGLVDFGYRFYSPSTGRWINRDPIREEGGLNIYAMVGNSPVNDVDEYGLDPWASHSTAIAAKIRVIINLGADIAKHEQDLIDDRNNLPETHPQNRQSRQWHVKRIIDEKRLLAKHRADLQALYDRWEDECKRKGGRWGKRGVSGKSTGTLRGSARRGGFIRFGGARRPIGSSGGSGGVLAKAGRFLGRAARPLGKAAGVLGKAGGFLGRAAGAPGLGPFWLPPLSGGRWTDKPTA